MFLVFKQKTAYELRISDGSSDVCSSDLRDVQPDVFTTVPRLLEKVYDKIISRGMALSGLKKGLFFWALRLGMHYDPGIRGNAWYRPEERRVGKERVSTGRYRWSPRHYKEKQTDRTLSSYK